MSTCPRSVLSVLLWPLVVYHELIQRMYTGLEPILMKLDYSMKGDTEHRKHDKRSECRQCVSPDYDEQEILYQCGSPSLSLLLRPSLIRKTMQTPHQCQIRRVILNSPGLICILIANLPFEEAVLMMTF